MMAVQIFRAARGALPDLDADMAAGDFSKLKSWLNENIHKVGGGWEAPGVGGGGGGKGGAH